MSNNSMIGGIVRSQMSKKGSRGEGAQAEDGTTEDPQADLRSHAVGLQMGSNNSSSGGGGGASHGHGHGHEDEEEGEGDEQLPPRRTEIPFHSSHDEYMAKFSQKMLYVFYGCGAIFAAIIIWQLIAQHKERHVIAWCVGAIFVSIAVPFSLHDIHMHTMHYVNPKLQKYYIRILWMVPIYAIESWLALRFRGQKLFLETAREAYEAYVIYNFYMLLLHYLGGGQAVRDILKAKSDAGDKFVHLIFPFCCWKWKRSGQFINRCTVGVIQYVIIRFFLAFVTCLVEYMQDHGQGNQVALERTVVAIIIIINVSQIWAMYCLVAFYHEFAYELRAINPFWKFVVVKMVVFLSFWQGLLFSGMAREGMIKSYMDYSEHDIASGIQNLLICIEMAVISVAHMYVFSYKDMEIIVKPEDMKPRAPWTAWVDILPWDVVGDFREHIFNGFGIRRKMQKKAALARSPMNGAAVVMPAGSRGAAAGGEGGGGRVVAVEGVGVQEEGGVGATLA